MNSCMDGCVDGHINGQAVRRRDASGVALLLLVVTALFTSAAVAQRGEFYSPQEYHEKIFPKYEMEWRTLWLNGQQRQSIENILGRNFPAIRIRYWGEGDKTGWIFEEVGKELPITVGVTVVAGAIADITVLEYRESRGGEVRYPFFTEQFMGVRLSEEDVTKFTQSIDGITGATLSVRAMKKIATLALFCHQLTPFARHDREISTSQ